MLVDDCSEVYLCIDLKNIIEVVQLKDIVHNSFVLLTPFYMNSTCIIFYKLASICKDKLFYLKSSIDIAYQLISFLVNINKY